jgi:hypothetical protein
MLTKITKAKLFGMILAINLDLPNIFPKESAIATVKLTRVTHVFSLNQDLG